MENKVRVVSEAKQKNWVGVKWGGLNTYQPDEEDAVLPWRVLGEQCTPCRSCDDADACNTGKGVGGYCGEY